MKKSAETSQGQEGQEGQEVDPKKRALVFGSVAAVILLAARVNSEAQRQLPKHEKASETVKKPLDLTPLTPEYADLQGRPLKEWFQTRYDMVQEPYYKGKITSPQLIGVALTNDVVNLEPQDLISFNTLLNEGEMVTVFLALSIPEGSGNKAIVQWVHRTDGKEFKTEEYGGRPAHEFDIQPSWRFRYQSPPQPLDAPGIWQLEVKVKVEPGRWKTLFTKSIEVMNTPDPLEPVNPPEEESKK